MTHDGYSVYLLQLEVRPKLFYIGLTPDPVRRLRQHNGELALGACRTKRYRPWRLVLLVYNFPSKVAALQFEHAYQHPHRTRHIPLRFSTASSMATLKHRLANLRLLLASPLFRNMALRVMILDEAIHRAYAENPFGAPDTVSVELASDLAQLTSHINFSTRAFTTAKDIVLKFPPCGMCHAPIDLLGDQPLVTVCRCTAAFHLLCLARSLPLTGIFPEGQCLCGAQVVWPDLAKIATRLRLFASNKL